MSSEKRSINPCTFERDVPPLKTRDLPKGGLHEEQFQHEADPEILFDDGRPDPELRSRFGENILTVSCG
jgi:hypothetical protein